jgi:hypothetical protein
MANQGPTIQELQELINQLQVQVMALQNTAPVVQAAPNAATTQVVFADSPQTIGVDAIIDYLKKLGKDIYEKGCSALGDKALTDGFNMTPNETVVFVEAFERKAKLMGWSTGTKQITNRGCTGEFSKIFFSNTFSSHCNFVDMVCRMNIHQERF